MPHRTHTALSYFLILEDVRRCTCSTRFVFNSTLRPARYELVTFEGLRATSKYKLDERQKCEGRISNLEPWPEAAT